MTNTTTIEKNILDTIQKMTDPDWSAFSDVGREIVCANVARADLERYGDGMPLTNQVIKKLLAEEKIVRTKKGRLALA